MEGQKMEKKPVWYSNYSLITSGIVVVALLMIYICKDIETLTLLNYLPVAFSMLIFVISLAWFAFRKKKKINNDPLYSFAFMMYLLIILTVTLPIISKLGKEKVPDWYFAILFLTMAMSIIHAVFKQQQNRIDKLEEKLNQQNQARK